MSHDYGQGFENAIGAHILNGVAYTPPSQWYLGLMYENVDSDYEELGQGGNVAGGYARVPVDLSFNSQTGEVVNEEQVAFPVATTDWSEFMSVGFWDAPTGGNLCDWQYLYEGDDPIFRQTVKAGQQAKFGIGHVTVWGYPASVGQNMTPSYSNKILNWLYRGGVAVPLGGIQIILTDNNHSEFTIGNGYARKTATWVLGGPGYETTAEVKWTVTGAWTPNIAPVLLGLHNGVEGICYGGTGLSSVLVNGDFLSFPAGTIEAWF